MYQDTSTHWPRRAAAPAGAPNIIVVLTDDVGYGACSTFGGPIETPHLDQLASNGLRYTQFHTAALCAPTRASLLTGRNPHRVAMGALPNYPAGFEGYTGVIPPSAGTVARVLQHSGYSTAMFGKGHVTPEWEMSQAGPFDRWPTGLGFDYFYGFLGYDTNMWAPSLVENTSFIEPPQHCPPRHFDEMMADRAVDWITQQRAIAPDRPFFIYYATGTAHSPHHAPAEWLQKYRGRFDSGWDVMRQETFARQKKLGVIPTDANLSPRPDNLPAWNTLGADHKMLAARLMEAYAAALAHADFQVGRLLSATREMGEADNTLVIFIQGDNGGSAEGGFNGVLFEQSWINGFEEDFAHVLAHIDDIGGPAAYNHFPAGWGWAMNSPFQYYKQVASHFGGTRNGMVMSWPARIATGGGTRAQFHHVSDIMPTVLEAAGVPVPAHLDGVHQDPLDGISMLYTVADASAPSGRKRQVFECLENFGIYDEPWFAGTRPVNEPWVNMSGRVPSDPHQRQWELYDIRADYSQTVDLAREHPGKLAELQTLFWNEAEAGKILPIHPPGVGSQGRPSLGAGRKHFTYRRRISRVPSDAAPNTIGKSFSITADIAIGDTGGDGVIVCHGSRFCGYSLYLRERHLVFHYNAVQPHAYTIRTPSALAPGMHRIGVRFHIDEARAASSGTATLLVDGEAVATGRIERTLRSLANQDGFNVGCDTVSAVSHDYTIATSLFDGELSKVEIDLE